MAASIAQYSAPEEFFDGFVEETFADLARITKTDNGSLLVQCDNQEFHLSCKEDDRGYQDFTVRAATAEDREAAEKFLSEVGSFRVKDWYEIR